MDQKDKSYDGTVACRVCGKPVVVQNRFGMFCEDRCGEATAKKADDLLSKMMPGLWAIQKEKMEKIFGVDGEHRIPSKES